MHALYVRVQYDLDCTRCYQQIKIILTFQVNILFLILIQFLARLQELSVIQCIKKEKKSHVILWQPPPKALVKILTPIRQLFPFLQSFLFSLSWMLIIILPGCELNSSWWFQRAKKKEKKQQQLWARLQSMADILKIKFLWEQFFALFPISAHKVFTFLSLY